MKILVQFFAVILVFPLHGQTVQEDILAAIKSSENWSEQSILYDSLASLSFKQGLGSYRSTLNLIIEQVKALGQFDEAAKFGIELAETYHRETIAPDSALMIINGIFNWQEKISMAQKGDLLVEKALAYFHKDLPDSAFYFYQQASQVFENLADSSQVNFGKAYMARAGLAMDFGEFTEASNLLDKAHRLYEYQNDSLNLLYCINDKANLYSMNGFLEKAAAERELLLNRASPEDHGILLIITYLNYSNEARKLGKGSLELDLLKKSILLVDSTSNNIMQYHFIALCKLINGYSRRDLHDQAIYYFDKMQILLPRFKDSDWLQEYYLRAKIDALYSKGQYKEAIAQAKGIRQTAELRKEIETVMDMDRLLQRIYIAVNDYQNAYIYFYEFSNIKDSLSSIEKTNALLYLETQYEDERKKRVIAGQENKIKLLATTNQFQTKLIWTGSIGLIFLFGAIYLYRSRKYAVKAKQIQENFSQQLLSSQEEERKRISRDLHDSVGQSLILIKNKVILDQNPDTVTMVSQALEEVRSISKALHPILLEKLGLTASIEKLIKDFDKHSDIFFIEEIDQIDGVFPKEHELQLFRIVQEAVNNIIKHASTSSVLVKIINDPKKVTLVVQDYGIGFDITSLDHSSKSLGMKTLKERTQILGGKMVIDSVKNQGTTITLEIKKPHGIS